LLNVLNLQNSQISTFPTRIQISKMPPKKMVSAPPNRVYESARPKRQTKLPEQKKRIKSYGKKGGPRVGKPKDDDTLTQMGWVTLNPPFHEEEDDMDIYEEKSGKRRNKGRKSLPEEEADMDYEEGFKKQGNKRRKTLGDKPKTTLKYLTQTISQMDWSFMSAEDNLDKGEEDTYDIYDGPNSSQSLKGLNKAPKLTQSAAPARRISPQRIQAPSSQSSASPMSTHSRGSSRRSPLKEMSINTPIPFHHTTRRGQKSPDKLPRLEVKDIFTSNETSQSTRMPPTPARRSSPAKSVRFATPEEDEELPVALPTIKTEYFQRTQSSQRREMRTEILDSDAESDEGEDQEPEKPVQAVPGELEEQNPEEQELEDEAEEPMQTNLQDVEDLGPETCYGEIGLETQVEADRLLDLASSSDDVPENAAEELEEDTFQERTQMMESQRLTSQHVKSMAPRTMESDVFVSIHPTRVAGFLNRTRNHATFPRPLPPSVSRIWLYETAPVSTLRYMAVIGPAKRPGEILESGEGNAEFNANTSGKTDAYEIRDLYELANPLSLLELRSSEWLQRPPPTFNWVRPVVLDQLMANLMPPLFTPNSIQSTPPSSATDTQEAGEQLMSTIRQFTQPTHSPDPSITQTPSSNEQHSQAISSSQISYTEDHDDPELVPSSQIIKSEDPDIEEVIPSSQQESTPIKFRLPEPSQNQQASEQELTPIKSRPPGPSQATTVDLTQSQTPRQDSLTEIIFESPRRPIPSSTPLRLPTPRSGTSEYQGPESLVPYSMASSQLLTKSQILPEGLLAESVPGPPTFVGDSDEEEEDDYLGGSGEEDDDDYSVEL
jgi:hypothetical protein